MFQSLHVKHHVADDAVAVGGTVPHASALRAVARCQAIGQIGDDVSPGAALKMSAAGRKVAPPPAVDVFADTIDWSGRLRPFAGDAWPIV